MVLDGKDTGNDELSRILYRKAVELSRQKPVVCCNKTFNGVIEIEDAGELEELIDSCRNVFINFYSTTCPYCEIFHQVFNKVAKMFSKKALFAKINISYHPELAYMYNIMATPTTLVFIDGRLATSIPGYVPYDIFINIVRRALKKTNCLN